MADGIQACHYQNRSRALYKGDGLCSVCQLKNLPRTVPGRPSVLEIVEAASDVILVCMLTFELNLKWTGELNTAWKRRILLSQTMDNARSYEKLESLGRKQRAKEQ